jgi:putative oxidoreductase
MSLHALSRCSRDVFYLIKYSLNMKTKSPLFLIRIALIITFLMHSVPSIITGDVNGFGTMYLDKVGYAPYGLYIAWLIKLSHLGLVAALISNIGLRPMIYITVVILLMGIWMVHLPDGWFVIGGGRNGVEFNIFLILSLAAVLTESYRNK